MIPHQYGNQVSEVLTHLNCPGHLIGKGNQALVFEYRSDQVVKIYTNTDIHNLEQLAAFQAKLALHPLPFSTPQILEIGRVQETYYTIERYLHGDKLSLVFTSLSQQDQYRALTNYFTALEAFNAIKVESCPYGQVLPIDDAFTASTWLEFLTQKLLQSIEESRSDLIQDVAGLEEKMAMLLYAIQVRIGQVPKHLVHGDYYLNNVLFTENLEVSAVLDFSDHTVVGDKRMDVAGAIVFLALDESIRNHHISRLQKLAEAQYGSEIHKLIDIYTLYYSFYYSDTKQSDPSAYAWCIRNLNDRAKWQHIQS